MTVLTETGLTRFTAGDDGKIVSVGLAPVVDGEVDASAATDHPTAAAFIFVGLDPNTGWLDGLVDLDPQGFVVTDRVMETSVPGVFAAGDVRAGSTKQLASAVGEGAAVALQIRHHLDTVTAGR